jgi:hypothetical protein
MWMGGGLPQAAKLGVRHCQLIVGDLSNIHPYFLGRALANLGGEPDVVRPSIDALMDNQA